MSYTDSDEKKGKSISVPFRLSPENDVNVRQFMAGNQIENRNLAMNIMLSNAAAYDRERAKAKETILKLMNYWKIKLKELE